MKNIFYLIVFGFFVSCTGKNKVPSEIIQPSKMQNILWDVMRAQALSTETARKDSTINEVAETKVLTQKVFDIYKVTPKAFDQSYNWYTNHPDIMKTLFDSLNDRKQRESQLEQKEKFLPGKSTPLKRLDSIKKINAIKKSHSFKLSQ
ncbi:MAG TPA: DUF4296 domain-containing protein [Ginsengibacter sp.]|nr:DUF4296 domain-containing protein [Ginsengibacter sp.]